MFAPLLQRCIVITAVLCLHIVQANSQSACDNDHSCIGNALLFPGGEYDYVDVFNTPALRQVDTTNELTVSMWATISRQPGVRQHIAGVWGPRTDRDDRWLLFIDEKDSLTFELSDGNTNFGRFDNTIIKTAMVYDVWMHIAAMWDGTTQEARLYINGQLLALGRNTDYPLTLLRVTDSYLQLGSYNGMTNDPTMSRPLTGQLDEIQIWNRVLDEDQLRCNRHTSLEGNEPGLILYFRCNEIDGDILCDASPSNGKGNRRGSLQFVPASRTVPQSVFVSPLTFSFPLNCTSDTTFHVTVTDTSACLQKVALYIIGRDAPSFTLTADTVVLQQNLPVSVEIQTNIRISGFITADLVVQPLNSCNPRTVIPITIDRSTELTPTPGVVLFDTLFGCISTLTSDTTLTICNNSTAEHTITALNLSSSAFSAMPSGWSLPIVVAPGDCKNILLRFAPVDTGSYSDTLRIVSTDPCPGSGLIPLTGQNIAISRITIDSVNFDRPGLTCKRSLNLTEEFFLRNMTGENITVEAIEFSTPEFSTPTTLPFFARPNVAYRMYIRFKSSVEGDYSDTARIRMSFRGCTVYRSIPLHGKIIELRLAVQDTVVDFGDVIVGHSLTLPVTIENNGSDSRDLFLYLNSGRAFSFSGASRVSVGTSTTQTINVTFRPLSRSFFRDTLNFQDVGCQTVIRVIVQGNGVEGSLSFTPGSLHAGNVITCQCRDDTIIVTNNSDSPITLRAVSISGSAKFTFLIPVPIANEVLQPLQQRLYRIQYCPANAPDYVTDYADIVFDTDGPDSTLTMLLTGTNIQPKLTIDVSTDFDDVEVGGSRTMIIRITNPAPTPVEVSTLLPLPAGFTVVSAVPPIGSVLQYRDTMLVSVRFNPTDAIVYGGDITVTSVNPCSIQASGQIIGRGVIVPLFVPWSTIVFSEATRCDSVLRIIGLVNDGSVPIRIDSIWITGTDAMAFTWSGRTFSGSPPRNIAAHNADSIDIYFHPRYSTAVQSFAQLHIAATNRLGQQIFTINLAGGRIEQFIPNRRNVAFPATPVHNTSTPLRVVFQNPSYLETLYIDTVSFIPDQAVFSFTGTLPLVIPPRQSAFLDFGFYPRASLDFTARIHLVTRAACIESDTSMSISGSGYAPPWLVTLCIDTTVTADIGEVLRLPLTLNRDIPQNPLDLELFVQYYKPALQYLGFEPLYSSQIVRDTLQREGVKIKIAGNQNLKAGPVGYISFRVAAADSMQFLIGTDSIGFASDSVLIVTLFGDGCFNSVTVNPNCGISRLISSEYRYMLAQNYPNPVSSQTSIEFETLEDTDVSIVLYDAGGRVVTVLTDGLYQHGRYLLSFDTSALSPGVYRYTMTTSQYRATRSMIVLH